MDDSFPKYMPELEVCHPVKLNTWKHHAGALRARIAAIAARGPAGLVEMGTRLAVLGARLMDLYTGALSPCDLSNWVVEELRRIDRLDLERYRAWLMEAEDYVVFTHPADGSRWVLRLGDERGRYVHLHPGRWSPHSARVRANVLKTAFLVQIHVRLFGGDPMDRAVINEVRREYLQLSPLGDDPEGGLGLGAILAILRGEPEG
jgi:hypothetical protein